MTPIDFWVSLPIATSENWDRNNLLLESEVMGDLQFMFEFFLKTFQEDHENDCLKWKYLAGWLEELSSGRPGLRIQGKGSLQGEPVDTRG